MSNALDILKENVKVNEDLTYRERELDERFTAVDILSQTGVVFNLFFYVVDTKEAKVFYGDFTLPDGAVIERILRHDEQPVTAA